MKNAPWKEYALALAFALAVGLPFLPRAIAQNNFAFGVSDGGATTITKGSTEGYNANTRTLTYTARTPYYGLLRHRATQWITGTSLELIDFDEKTYEIGGSYFQFGGSDHFNPQVSSGKTNSYLAVLTFRVTNHQGGTFSVAYVEVSGTVETSTVYMPDLFTGYDGYSMPLPFLANSSSTNIQFKMYMTALGDYELTDTQLIIMEIPRQTVSD